MQNIPLNKLEKIFIFSVILSGLALVLGEHFTLSVTENLQYLFRTVFWISVLLYIALRLSSRIKPKADKK